MEQKHPTPHHVAHPHPGGHPSNFNLNYDPMTMNYDSHDQFSDSHDYTDIDQTTVEQFNYDFYPNQAYAPIQTPYQAPVHGHAAACAPMACPPACLPEKYDPPHYDPPQQSLTNTVQNVVVPHFHPTHTTHNLHTHIVNQHYFPHTDSCCYSESCEDVFCGVPQCPCPPSPFVGGAW